jgi:hypothetical protein
VAVQWFAFVLLLFADSADLLLLWLLPFSYQARFFVKPEIFQFSRYRGRLGLAMLGYYDHDMIL